MNNVHPIFTSILEGICPSRTESAMSKIHGLTHDAAYALETGDIAETKRLLKAIDDMTHEEIGKEAN